MDATFKPDCQSTHKGERSPNKEGSKGSDLRAKYYQLCGCYEPHAKKLRKHKSEPRRETPTGMDILARKNESEWCEQDLTRNLGKCYIHEGVINHHPDNFDWSNPGDGVANGKRWSASNILDCANKTERCATALNTYHNTCIQNSDQGHEHFRKLTNNMNKKWKTLSNNVYQGYLKQLYASQSTTGKLNLTEQRKRAIENYIIKGTIPTGSILDINKGQRSKKEEKNAFAFLQLSDSDNSGSRDSHSPLSPKKLSPRSKKLQLAGAPELGSGSGSKTLKTIPLFSKSKTSKNSKKSKKSKKKGGILHLNKKKYTKVKDRRR